MKFTYFLSLTGSGFRWVGRTPLPKFLLSSDGNNEHHKHANPFTSNQTRPVFNARIKLWTFHVSSSELRLVRSTPDVTHSVRSNQVQEVGLIFILQHTRPMMKPSSGGIDALPERRKRSDCRPCCLAGREVRLVPRTFRVYPARSAELYTSTTTARMNAKDSSFISNFHWATTPESTSA